MTGVNIPSAGPAELTPLQQMQKDRADYMATESADTPLDMDKLHGMLKAEYDEMDRVAGREPIQPTEERDPHKTTFDLEDVTGNPGHRGVTPYAPPSINPAGFSGSINEPPGMPRADEVTAEQMPPEPDAPVVQDESEQPPPFLKLRP